MAASLNGKRVAILVTDGFEQVELTGPKEALENKGATVHIISAKNGEVTGWNHTTPATKFHVDDTFDSIRMEDYDALLLPRSWCATPPVKTRRPSLTDDLMNAGAEWVDEQVVVDGHLISSRKPDDIPAFSEALIEALTA